MNKNTINIVGFDLDGTLLNDNKQVSNTDLKTLSWLESQSILRIVATGRNLYSLKKVLPENFPVDYAVFSSGAGIYNWKTQEIIKTWHLKKSEIIDTIEKVETKKLNYTIHLPIPNNHHTLIHAIFEESTDLKNYVSHYQDFSKPFDNKNIPERATQLVVLVNGNKELYKYFEQQLPHLKTIRTTSPVDNKSNWIEVFNKNVSKANGIRFIIEYLAIKNPRVFTIGNDYNDVDLLNFGNISYVVKNAPEILKQTYQNTSSNNEHALTTALSNHLSFIRN